MGQSLFLRGQPGVGKTTIMQTVAARLGLRAGGFYTEEIRNQGRRTGFRLVTLDIDNPQEATLASVNSSSRYRVGRYGIHLEDLERIGVAALWRAVEQPCVEVVLIDEIGKMELFSSAFRDAVLAALNSSKPVVATVMAGSHWFVEAIGKRPDANLIEVTLGNRQAMVDRIFDWLTGNRDMGRDSLLCSKK